MRKINTVKYSALTGHLNKSAVMAFYPALRTKAAILKMTVSDLSPKTHTFLKTKRRETPSGSPKYHF